MQLTLPLPVIAFQSWNLHRWKSGFQKRGLTVKGLRQNLRSCCLRTIIFLINPLVFFHWHVNNFHGYSIFHYISYRFGACYSTSTALPNSLHSFNPLSANLHYSGHDTVFTSGGCVFGYSKNYKIFSWNKMTK